MKEMVNVISLSVYYDCDDILTVMVAVCSTDAATNSVLSALNCAVKNMYKTENFFLDKKEIETKIQERVNFRGYVGKNNNPSEGLATKIAFRKTLPVATYQTLLQFGLFKILDKLNEHASVRVVTTKVGFF